MTPVTTIEDPILFIDVCEELMDPQWDFRTVAGIASSIGYQPEEVEGFLEEHVWLVRWLPVLDEDGHQLLAWAGKKRTWRERKLCIRAYLAKDYPMNRYLVMVEDPDDDHVAPVAGIYCDAESRAQAIAAVRKYLQEVKLVAWKKPAK